MILVAAMSAHAPRALGVALSARLLVFGVALGASLGAGRLGRRVAGHCRDGLAEHLLDVAERLLSGRISWTAERPAAHTRPFGLLGSVDMVCALR